MNGRPYNIDHVLKILNNTLVADFSSKEKYFKTGDRERIMNNSINYFQSWLRNYISNFYNQDEEQSIILQLKEQHIMQVFNYALKLCDILCLPDNKQNIAMIISLFHDFGFFENFLKQDSINTFTVDGAKQSVRALNLNKILLRLPKSCRQAILKSIAFQNNNKIPERLGEEIIFYIKLIKDSIQLANWHFLIESYKKKNKNIQKFIEPDLPDLPDCSSTIINSLIENQVPAKTDITTLNDFKLYQIGQIFNIKLASSFAIVIKEEIIDKLFSILPKTKEVAIAAEYVKEYLESCASIPVRSDYDSPWKEMIEKFFKQFMEFFFPKIAEDIDWDRGYESLNNELLQITREAKMGGRLADKLMKVWKKSGEETWVLAHIEVQAQKENDFSYRTYVYNYRSGELFQKPVISLAILADNNPNWYPKTYSQTLWDCGTEFRFKVKKILDYKSKWDELKNSDNLFAFVVMAHLKTLETCKDNDSRLKWKIELTKNLYKQGLNKQQILDLFHFIDWIMVLPKNLEQGYLNTIQKYKEEKKMRYINVAERFGIKQGEIEGEIKGEIKTCQELLQDSLLPQTLADKLKKKISELTKKLEEFTYPQAQVAHA